ncbi:MAG: uridylate kinase [Pseudomonadota bacterium]|nr:uridylate kinase [Pseudomonadota bacterium]
MHMQQTPKLKYPRILLKLSGEALMGKENNASIFDQPTINSIIIQIKQLIELGVKLGIVIGGGNIFRGINGTATLGLHSANADYMGMLATIMNGIAFKDFLTNSGVKSKIYSALTITNIVKGYNRDSMMGRLEDGNVIIFAGGTGNPYFTTDSAAALRAIEMKADLLIKATKVDGVYTADPMLDRLATKYAKISFTDVIQQNLKVMDMAAFDLCRQHKINIDVCNIFNPNSLFDSALGNTQGTLIHA